MAIKLTTCRHCKQPFHLFVDPKEVALCLKCLSQLAAREDDGRPPRRETRRRGR
jgi:hypothetical protein